MHAKCFVSSTEIKKNYQRSCYRSRDHRSQETFHHDGVESLIDRGSSASVTVIIIDIVIIVIIIVIIVDSIPLGKKRRAGGRGASLWKSEGRDRCVCTDRRKVIREEREIPTHTKSGKREKPGRARAGDKQ